MCDRLKFSIISYKRNCSNIYISALDIPLSTNNHTRTSSTCDMLSSINLSCICISLSSSFIRCVDCLRTHCYQVVQHQQASLVVEGWQKVVKYNQGCHQSPTTKSLSPAARTLLNLLLKVLYHASAHAQYSINNLEFLTSFSR